MRTRLVLGSALLFAGNASVAASAQDATAQADAPLATPDEIVVIGRRVITPVLSGVAPEREYDSDQLSTYGASTVEELIDEIRAENGDRDDPVLLVNGEPVADIGDIGDFPAEAVERVEVLPRGSGQRIGRSAERRVYNVVLRNQVRSLTLEAGGEFASEGEWAELQGEAIASRIAGRNRLNLSLRTRGSDALSEADRDLVQPRFGSFGAVVDYVEPVDTAAYRTLRGKARSYEASLSGANALAPWLNATFSLRGRLTRDEALSGLPSGLFVLPASSPHAIGGQDSLLGLYGPDPLRQRTRNRHLAGNLTLNATRGAWLATFAARLTAGERRFANDRQDYTLLAQPAVLPAARNPFTDPLADYFALGRDTATARERSSSLRLELGGPLAALPAGTVRVRAAAEREDSRLRAIRTGSQASDRTYRRAATRIEAGLDVPLASRMAGVLAGLGELNLSLDHSRTSVDRLPDLDHSSAALLWQPAGGWSVSATIRRSENLPQIELLADPVTVYDHVRTYDYLTGRTVDVAFIAGGNPTLRPIVTTARKLSLSVAPWQRYNLQLTLDYERTTSRDFVAAVPPASAEVYQAFPDRFVRDAAGALISVDARPANYERQSREELRYGFSLLVPVGSAPAGGAAPRLQLVGSHSLALRDEVRIRTGLPTVDLLDGGSLGVGGGRPRHLANGSVSYSERRFGLRLSGQYRSARTLQTPGAAIPENLRFAPIFTASLQAHAELPALLPDFEWAKGARLTLGVSNIGNARQRVTDAGGDTPLRYQRAYRDPVGRTLAIELRKTF